MKLLKNCSQYTKMLNFKKAEYTKRAEMGEEKTKFNPKIREVCVRKD